MSRALRIRKIYESLLVHYGPQGWWPADSALECIVGTILTQNTAWTNVEKALGNLQEAGLLGLDGLLNVQTETLAALIRPSGYYNQKAIKIKKFLSFFMDEYGGSFDNMFSETTDELRRKLLSVKGIGPETADSILLYAAEKPVFVVDSYTVRIFQRHGLVPEESYYDDVQEVFHDSLAADTLTFNEYHALLVKVGKENCKKRSPVCAGCPLEHDPHSI